METLNFDKFNMGRHMHDPDMGNVNSVYEGSTTYATYADYNSLGQPGAITYGNGVATSYIYDSDNNRLDSLYTTKSGNVYQNMAYGYDNAGNITSITDYTDNNQSHDADKIARLGDLNSATYGYPTNGTRPHAVSTAGSNTYSYDNNGNMTTGAGRSITYDPENRPYTINNGTTTTFTYDGSGERVKKAAGSTTTVYINGLYECTGGTCTKYIFANGQRIAAKTNTNTFYYHTDHLGGSSVITDNNGNEVEYIAYYPFGQTRIDSGTATMPYKYTGQELDSETGLYNYNARLYDPVLGKFITADSIVPNPGDPQSFNRYAYVRNNPINLTDPSGHSWLSKHTGISIKVGGDVGNAINSAGNWAWDNRSDIASVAIVAATAYCWGCGAWAQGALVGELVGGYSAHQSGGDMLQGVIAGGIVGGITGMMFEAAGTMTQGANPLVQIGARGFVGGSITSIMRGKFETGFMYAAAAATAYWGYTYMAGTEPTMAPGENNLPDGHYWPNEQGQAPVGSNVVGVNDGMGGFWSQGGPVSNVGNAIPGINATAHLHDYWMNNMSFNLVTNVGTMVPAAVMSYGAQLGGQLAPITVQQAAKDSR